VIQHVVLHGDVSHTRARWGADASLQRRGLGEATSFTTHRGHHILVDAGEPGSALHKKIHGRVDVLLLTHNDQDHVGGVPELLSSSMKIGQIWLPFDWHLFYNAAANLVDAIRSHTDLTKVARQARGHVTSAVAMLRQNLMAMESMDSLIDSPSLNRRGTRRLYQTIASLNSEVGAGVVDYAGDALAKWIGSPEQTAGGVSTGGATDPRGRATVRTVDAVLGWEGQTCWFSIDHASLPTRSTDVAWERSGLPGEFTVVNAWPVRTIPLPQPPSAAFAYALFAALYRLTIQNRRALVALGHAQLGCGHILFASDSAFEFDHPTHPKVPWVKIGAAVGLHHGSANPAHDCIYERFRGTVVARSGSRAVQRTSRRFTDVPLEHRGCTWCHADGPGPGGLDRHRDVVLEASWYRDWRVTAGACTDCPRFTKAK
jgi:hypothetical protein